MENLYKDLEIRCPKTDFNSITVDRDDYFGLGKVLLFVFNEKHSFMQVWKTENTYEENLENTITILNQHLEEIENAENDGVNDGKTKSKN